MGDNYKFKVITKNLFRKSKCTNVDPELNTPVSILIQTKNTSTKKSELWVSNSGNGKVTNYTIKGKKLPTVLIVPPAIIDGIGSPTGLVYNPTNGFQITNGSTSPLKSILIVATNDGTLAGWNPNVDATQFITTYRATDDPNYADSRYTDLAIAGNFLYATNYTKSFIDVFDNTFTKQDYNDYPFNGPKTDSQFSPYGIKYLNGNLYINYVFLLPPSEPNNKNPPVGPGFGFINEFTTSGQIIRRVVNGLLEPELGLNVPYGLTFFTNSFARNSTNAILSGQEGSGYINIYQVNSGRLNQILSNNCVPLIIPEIRTLQVFSYKGSEYIYYVSGGNNTSISTIGIIYKCEKK